MPRSYKILGQELAPYVVDWGTTEETKEVLLAQSQLFMGQHVAVLANENGRFTPLKAKSLFFGRGTQQIRADLAVDGSNLFSGFVKGIDPSSSSRTVTVTAQNVFTVPANSVVVLSTTANPAYVMRVILENAGLSEFIDPVSFAAAGSGAAAAGATITVNYPAGGSTTALGAIQAISSLCSLSCYVQGGLIRLRAWRPYQGSNEGVKYKILPKHTRDFGELKDCPSNLVNSVTITYGASLTFSQVDVESVKRNKVTVPQNFSAATGELICVPDLASASYFSNLFLARASTLKRQGGLMCGPELVGAHIGDRVTVAAPAWSTDPLAMEILETHHAVDSDGVELVCVTI